MQKQIVWVNGDEDVQQALRKMQQADVGYVLVGTEASLEGVVSMSDIKGAVSIYLRPTFAKWHRAADDATLQIRIKWIMTKSVRTIKPQTSIAEIMENIQQSGVHCLPVLEADGRTVGLVTVFDVFEALPNTEADISVASSTVFA